MSTATAPTRLRITRRGRAVLSFLVAAPIVAVILGLALAGGEATATSGPGEIPVVTVEAGQNLWQVAEAIAPDANPADVVADILAINELSGASVMPGQTLVIPARYAD